MAANPVHKIVRFRIGRSSGYGLLEGGAIYRLSGSIFGEFKRGEKVGRVDAARLLSPCVPSKVVAVGRNYSDHVAEIGGAVPEEPRMFFKPPSSIVGPGADIVYPSMTKHVEAEAELAIVMRRKARNVSEANALDYVLGYTCANDVSARDIQHRESMPNRAKAFDTFCPLGPCIAVGLDPSSLAIQSRVNGQVRQSSSTSLLIHNVPRIISFISEVLTLLPGDVILSGTMAGTPKLVPGDVVDIVIEGIGELSNRVVAQGKK